MSQPVQIDPSQSAQWAQESTLRKLLESSIVNNGVLEDYLKSSMSKEQVEELRKSRAAAEKNAKDTTKAVDKIKPRIDMSLNDAFNSLNYELKRSVDNIKSGITSGDVGSVMQGISTQSKAASKGLLAMSKELPGTHRAAALLTSGFLAYAGVAAALFGIMTNLNKEFSKLYETGINVSGGLQGLTRAASDMGISTSELVGTLSNFGSAVTALGTDRTLKLATDFSKLRSQTAALGMTNQDAIEALMEYTELQRQNGLLAGMSNDQLIKGTQEYYSQITAVSAVTGKQRKEIEKSIKAQTKDLDYQLVLRGLPKEIQQNIQKAMTAVQALGNEGAEAARDFLTTTLSGKGMAGLDASFRNMLAQTGLYETFQELSDNAAAGRDVSGQVSQIAAKMGDPEVFRSFQALAKVGGPAGDMARKFVQLAQSTENQRQADLKLDEIADKQYNRLTQTEQWEKARAEAKKEQERKQAAENQRTLEADKAMRAATATLQGMFQNLAVNVLQPMLPVFEGLAKVIEIVTGGFKWLADGLADMFAKIPFFGATRAKGADGKEDPNGQVESGAARVAGDLLATGAVAGAGYGLMRMRRNRRNANEAQAGKQGPSNMPAPSGPLSDTVSALAGAGPGIGDTLKGMAVGLGAFANPKILVGAGIFSLSIAAIVTGLGAGVAAASFLIGKSLPTLSEGLKSFTEVDGEKLGSAALGITKLSGALVLFTGSNVISALGGLASGIIGFFQEDPINKFKRFAEIGEPLEKAGNSMQQFASVYPQAMAAINNARFNPDGLNSLERLRAMFQGEGFFSSLGKGIASMLGQGDFMTQLTRFSDSSEKIGNLSNSLSRFGDSYARLAEVMSRTIPQETLNSLQRAIELSARAESRPGLFSSLFGNNSPVPANAAPTTPTTNVNTGLNQDDLSKKTVDFYTNSTNLNQRLVDLLQAANDKLDMLERATRDGSTEVARKISSSSGTLY